MSKESIIDAMWADILNDPREVSNAIGWHIESNEAKFQKLFKEMVINREGWNDTQKLKFAAAAAEMADFFAQSVEREAESQYAHETRVAA